MENGSPESGAIFIQVYEESKSQTEVKQQMETFARDVASAYNADTNLQIDGYNAMWFTLSTIAYTAQENLHVQQELIYLFTEDRYYTLELYLLESEIGGRVHKEFEELIKSIKVLP